jgi:hypothetical protein
VTAIQSYANTSQQWILQTIPENPEQQEAFTGNVILKPAT